MTDFTALVSELEEATLAFGIHQGRSPMDDQLQRRIRCRAARYALHAALSAHSTGSAGVAAEPAAWAYEYEASDGWQRALWWQDPRELPRNKERPGYLRNIRPLYEHPPVAAEPVAGWKLVPVEPTEELISRLTHIITASAWGRDNVIKQYGWLLAAAPTPPAGGGETEPEEGGRYKGYIRKALECTALRQELAETKAALADARSVPVPSTATLMQASDCAVCGCEPQPIPNCPQCGGYPVKDILQIIEDRLARGDVPGHNFPAEWRPAVAATMRAALAPAAPRKGPSGALITRTIWEKTGCSPEAAQEAANALALLASAGRGETQAVGESLCPVPGRYDMGECCGFHPCIAVPDQNRGEPDQGGAITEDRT